MKHLRAVNQKAQRIERNAEALKEDIIALQAAGLVHAEGARPHGMHHHLFPRMGDRLGRRYGRTMPARGTRYLRLLRHLLLARPGS